jgi:hypothetical protein
MNYEREGRNIFFFFCTSLLKLFLPAFAASTGGRGGREHPGKIL